MLCSACCEFKKLSRQAFLFVGRFSVQHHEIDDPFQVSQPVTEVEDREGFEDPEGFFYIPALPDPEIS